LNIIAQINFEQTLFGGSVQHVKTHLKSVYYIVNINTNQITFYNENYSIYKIVTINPPSGYKVNFITNVSDMLFNNDNLLEFTCGLRDTLNNTGYLLKLYDENGNELFNFGNATSAYPYQTFNSQLRFSVFRYSNYPNNTETDVYSLPGTMITGKVNIENDYPKYNPYPNPSSSIINLKYYLKNSEVEILNIFNSSGQLIEAIKIGGALDEIKLDVTNYAKGLYFYKYKNETKKFIVE